jgi:hypothetical protein
LKSLTKFFRKISKEKNIFWGLGVAFSVMIATIGLVGFILFGSFVIRNWFERYILESALFRLNIPTESTTTAPQATTPLSHAKNPLIDLFNIQKEKSLFTIIPNKTAPTTSQESLGYETFYDIFSGNGWIDQGRTTLYQERMTTAFLFPPKFLLVKATATNEQFVERKQDGSDERCIRGRCLKVQGSTLTFQGSKLSLPESVRRSEVVNVSIGVLEKMWAVGVTVKNGEDYEGWIFTFDGDVFSNVQREGKDIFISHYAGTIGFGGTDSDWMAVYGAYEGKAVHVRGSEISDVSRFFGIRVMAGGIDPEITRVGSGREATWFVWNKNGSPKLVKLFQNGTNEIAGAIDLSNEFGANLTSVTSMYVAPTSDVHTLVIKMIRDGAQEYWRFTDEGFDITSSRELVSASLTNRILPVVFGSIANLEYSDAGEKIEYFLSNDGVSWENAELGKSVTFANTQGDKLFWRIRVEAPTNQFLSPYFGQIEINYALKKGLQ